MRRRRGSKRGRLARALRGVVSLVAVVGLWWIYEAAKQYVGAEVRIVGLVTDVRDGDTIEVSGRAIRLKGLTCEERGTELGEIATREIRRIVAGERLTCVLTGERTYDRSVGRCSLTDGRDIGATLIARGACGRCDRYDVFRDYAAAQRRAGPFAGDSPGYCWAPW